MFIGQRRVEVDKQKNLEQQRQRVIAFKKFFGSDEGKEIMLDLMNKYYVLNQLPKLPNGLPDPVAEGQRQVVLYLLNRANVDMAQFDKILKGDFTA